MGDISTGRLVSASMSRLSQFTGEALADRMTGVCQRVLERRFR
jgi:hypothetical protein